MLGHTEVVQMILEIRNLRENVHRTMQTRDICATRDPIDWECVRAISSKMERRGLEMDAIEI